VYLVLMLEVVEVLLLLLLLLEVVFAFNDNVLIDCINFLRCPFFVMLVVDLIWFG
jgi:hypothetical protein